MTLRSELDLLWCLLGMMSGQLGLRIGHLVQGLGHLCGRLYVFCCSGSFVESFLLLSSPLSVQGQQGLRACQACNLCDLKGFHGRRVDWVLWVWNGVYGGWLSIDIPKAFVVVSEVLMVSMCLSIKPLDLG